MVQIRGPLFLLGGAGVAEFDEHGRVFFGRSGAFATGETDQFDAHFVSSFLHVGHATPNYSHCIALM